VQCKGTTKGGLIKMRHRRILIRKSPWFDFFTASLPNSHFVRFLDNETVRKKRNAGLSHCRRRVHPLSRGASTVRIGMIATL